MTTPRSRLLASTLAMTFCAASLFAARGATAACAPGFQDAGGGFCTAIIAFSGAPVMLTVPAGTGVLKAVVSGAAGGTSLEDEGVASAGGLGGRQTAVVPTVPGETLTILVGQSGADGILQPSGYGGWPDGGHSASRYGGSGGGGSYLFDSTKLLAAAGGGGGGGHDYNPAWAGTGNQLNWGGAGSGAAATDGNAVHFKGSPDPAYGSPGAGHGATMTGPGAGGTPDLPTSWFGFGISTGESGWGPTLDPNLLGKGGDSYPPTDTAGFGNGGGGGGGYYGGGGGGTIDSMVSGGGGGGGSGYVTPLAISSFAETGVQAGDGEVTISYYTGPCDRTCVTCSGPAATDCASCPAGLTLVDGTCVAVTTTITTATSITATSTTITTTVTSTLLATSSTTSTMPVTTTTTTIAAGPCADIPASGCRSARVSSVVIKDQTNDMKDRFSWTWTKGDATDPQAFMDPVHGTVIYRVCVYDGSARSQPLMRMDVPPGGTCGKKPCWRADKTMGFRYRNKTGIPDGLVSVDLQAGVTGHATIKAKGKGAKLPTPTLGLVLPVTVQLVTGNGAATECWRTTFTAASKNTAIKFSGKIP